MAWWQTLLVALASSLVGGVLASVGPCLLYWGQQRTRRREQAAQAVAAALAALREIDPDTYAERLRQDKRGHELITDKRVRWLAATDQLERIAATHPDTEIASLCESVIKKGGLVLIRLDELVGSSRAPTMPWLEAIPEQHAKAVKDAHQLLRALLH